MVLAAIGVSLWQYRQEVEARALLIGRATVASVEGLLRAQFESYDSALRLVIANFADPNLRMLDDDVWQRLLSNIRDSDPGIRSITVIGPGGRVLAGQGLQSDIDHTEAPFFSAHQASVGLGLLISDPAVGENGHHTVVLSRRITRSDGKFGGVAAIVVDLANVRRLLDPVPIGPMDSLTVVSGSGKVIARKPSAADDATAVADLSRNANFQRMQLMGSGSFVSRSSIDGVERLFTFDRVEGTKLILASGLATETLYANWKRQSFLIGGLAFVISAALVIAALRLTRESRLRAAAQDELEKQARTDFLTGLANRRQFDESLEREWRRTARTGADLSIILFDADLFKQLNDRHGHAVGDEVLKRIGAALDRCARRPGDLPARIGGEEFAMLLADTGAEGAHYVAERVRAALRETPSAQGQSLPTVTLSAGIASTTGRSAGSASDLLSAADAALYRAKEQGRDRVECARGGFGVLLGR
jgi:diguanylate cyclase (GGDEF)-like protein